MVGKGDVSTVGLSVAFSEFISSFVMPVYLMKLDKKSLFEKRKSQVYLFFNFTFIYNNFVSNV